MLRWRIIYPSGDRTRLNIAQVQSYEEDEWDIASSMYWENTYEGEQEAREHMEYLAEKHSLECPNSKRHYLD